MNSEVVQYYAREEMQPLKGSLTLYEKVLDFVREHWREETVPELQQGAHRIAPEAVLFTIWDRLRRSQGDASAEAETTKYIVTAQGSLRAVIAGTFNASDLECVHDLGDIPTRVADHYVALLKKVS